MKHIIVGGGIAGLVSALLLARRGEEVVLVEAQPKIGGLMGSFYNEDGIAFDYGAHFLKQVGIPEYDEILFGELEESEWQWLDRLKVGGIFGGSLYPESQFVDLRKLPEATYHRAVVELLSAKGASWDNGGDALSFSMAKYGKTITSTVLQPQVERLLGCPLDQLQARALGLVGYSRFLIFDRRQTIELKKSPLYDEVIGFPSWNDGINPLLNLYPAQDGIHRWVDHIADRIKSLGGTILCGTTVSEIAKSGNRVTSVTLSTGTTYETEQLIWAGGLKPLLDIAKVALPAGVTPPKFRSTALVNLIFDKPFETDLYYIYHHEPSSIAYRTTLFSNIRKLDKDLPPFSCTVEVMANKEVIEDENLVTKICAELVEGGIIGTEHTLVYENVNSKAGGFAIPTLELERSSRLLLDSCMDIAENLLLVGRSAGTAHFIHEVLLDVWDAFKLEKCSLP